MGSHNSIPNVVRMPSRVVIHPHTFEISNLIVVFTILEKECLSDSFAAIKKPEDVIKFISASINGNKLDQYYFKKDIIDMSCKQICPNKTTVWKEGEFSSSNFKLMGYNSCNIGQYINVATVITYLKIEYELKMSVVNQLVKLMMESNCDTVTKLISKYTVEVQPKRLIMYKRKCDGEIQLPSDIKQVDDECSNLLNAVDNIENIIAKYSDINHFDSLSEINNRLRVCTSNYELFMMCTGFSNSADL